MNFARKFSFRLESIKNYFRNICFYEFRKFGNKHKNRNKKQLLISFNGALFCILLLCHVSALVFWYENFVPIACCSTRLRLMV